MSAQPARHTNVLLWAVLCAGSQRLQVTQMSCCCVTPVYIKRNDNAHAHNVQCSAAYLCLPAMCLQAALELFPTVGITAVTSETYPHWVSTDPARVRVRPASSCAASGNRPGHLRLKPGSAAYLLICAIASLPANVANCPSLQVMLFTDKTEPPPLFRALRCATSLNTRLA